MTLQSITVETASGWVQGVKEASSIAFNGIRYAEAPQRYRPPQPVKPWPGLFQANAYGPAAPQSAPLEYNPQQSETDCLSLNLWTSGVETPTRPVLLFVHGGGFTGGSGSDPFLHGSTFVENGDLVFITVNYRLGVLGFLDLHEVLGEGYRSSGNCGVLDVIEALRWVHTNIARFGGDPSRVTIMGQSAGAKCIGGVLASPLADGLVHQAILMSGSVQSIRNRRTSSRLTQQFMASLGLASHEAHRLLEMPVDELMAAQQAWVRDTSGIHLFGPVMDDIVIPITSLQSIPVIGRSLSALLVGTTRQETAGFIAGDPILQHPNLALLDTMFGDNAPAVIAAYERRSRRRFEGEVDLAAWEAALTDAMYRISSIRTAKACSSSGTDVWLYRFDYCVSEWAAHGEELPFVWHRGFPADAQGLADRIHRAWINFVKNGSPAAEFPEWERFEESKRSLMLLNETSRADSLDDYTEDPAFTTQVLVR